jgi:hypothetical protein
MSGRADETDARAYVQTSARDCIAHLHDLIALGEYEHSGEARQDIGAGRIADLGLDPDAFDRYDAEEALDELPLAVEATTTFEVILGIGGPDRRLCLECDRIEGGFCDDGSRIPSSYELRRVCYRYSWSDSAELELSGSDRDVAEAFARRVVPELAD